jgi:plastocyanin
VRSVRLRRARGSFAVLAVAVAVAAVVAPALAVPAPAPAPAETTTIAMTGDPLTGSFSFRQDLVDLVAGDVVRFRNANGLATHQPAERNGLWGLSVPPGAEAERTMEAGTHLIVCRLHPVLMQATIRVSPVVTVTRRVVRRRDRRGRLRSRRVVRTATVRWAVAAPAAGQAFDVERRRQGGAWESLRSATSSTDASFSVAAGDAWQVRARLRGGDVVGAWSPVTSATS